GGSSPRRTAKRCSTRGWRPSTRPRTSSWSGSWATSSTWRSPTAVPPSERELARGVVGPAWGVVSPQGAPRPAHGARRGRETGDHVLHRHAVRLDDGLPRADLGILEDIGHVVHGRGGGVRLLEGREHLVERVGGAEL